MVAVLVVGPGTLWPLGSGAQGTETSPQCKPLPGVLLRARTLLSRARRALRGRPARREVTVAPPASPVMTVPGFTVRTLVRGLSNPTTMAFLDANNLLVLEKDSGRVRVVRGGAIVATAIDLAVNSYVYRGTLGIALHPGFRDNRFVYLSWIWRGRGNGPAGLEGADSGAAQEIPSRASRVDRFTWDGRRLRFDRNIIALPTPIVRGQSGAISGDHNGGIIRFGPDGKLYIHVGDQGLRGQLQNIPDGPAPADDALSGVVLRLNDDGSVPADNPFVQVGARLGGAAGRNLQRIFAYGIRNSFGMGFDPGTGALWMTENGDDTFDEVNRVPPGFNSGWVQMAGPAWCYEQFRDLEGRTRDGLDDLSPRPQDLAPTATGAEQRFYNLPGAQPLDPAFSWKFSMGPTAVEFLHGNALGGQLAGHMFVGSVAGVLFKFELAPDREKLMFADRRLVNRVADNVREFDLTESESLIFGRRFGIITDIVTGPNGHLFVTSLTHGAIYEILRNVGN